MKKLLTIFTLSLFANLTFGQNGCNDSVPNWGESLGVVSFKTNKTWIVGNQEWSDAVMATACQKETFNGGDWNIDNYNADCRSNPGYSDLFSWCAIFRFQNELCPEDWKIPTIQDFIDLDIAFGGTGYRRMGLQFIENYLSWGGTYSGCCKYDGLLGDQGSGVGYWSSTEKNLSEVSILYFHFEGSIFPQGVANKNFGNPLRCVRNK
jgi:uncharacterized protein (TIGR02145 family)